MKRLSLYSAIVLLVGVFSSCSDSSNPASPMTQNQAAVTVPLSSVNLIALPKHLDGPSLAKTTSPTVMITSAGGSVHVTDTYASGNGTVSIDMTLTLAPGAVNTPTPISITLDAETLTAEFSPSGTVFNIPATLSATVSGLDAIQNNPDVKLFYIKNLSCQQMNGDVSFANGTLTMTDGQIPHFSLFGFGFLK